MGKETCWEKKANRTKPEADSGKKAGTVKWGGGADQIISETIANFGWMGKSDWGQQSERKKRKW